MSHMPSHRPFLHQSLYPNSNSALSPASRLQARSNPMVSTKEPPRSYRPPIPSSQTHLQPPSSIQRGTPQADGNTQSFASPPPFPLGIPSSNGTSPSPQHWPAELITRESLQARIGTLLHLQVPRLTERAVARIAGKLSQTVIHAGQTGRLGPLGLATLSEIFTCIAHEGKMHSMCLGVSGPGAGSVKVILVGDPCEKEGRDPLHDEGLMELCRKGLEATLVRLWGSLNGGGGGGGGATGSSSVQYAKRWA